MRFNFKTSREVYDYVSIAPSSDAWAFPMIEAYLDEVDGEAFDTNELNQWLEDELVEIEEGFSKYIDNS